MSVRATLRILWVVAFALGLGIALPVWAQQPNIFTADVQMCSGRPWIDVRCPIGANPGAKGDGTTDDTASVNAVVAAAITNNWPVFFPAGTYKVTSKQTWDYQGIAANGLEIISRGATIDGRTIAAGNVLQIQCSGGTTGSPATCNNLQIEGDFYVQGNTPAYVVAIGKTDLSDVHNAARIEHLVVTNASANTAAGGIQANYLTGGDLWLSGKTAGGAASVGGVALEQVQTSKIAGFGSAAGASAPALLIENGNSVGNTFAGFTYDANTNTCLSLTSTGAARNAWLAPYFPCTTALSGNASASQNVLIGATYAGTNMGPNSGAFAQMGRGSLPNYKAPAVSAITLAGADDGTIFSSANATGPLAGWAAASLPVTLPSASSVGQGWITAFVTDNSKAVVVTAPGASAILVGTLSVASINVGPGNYRVAVIESDGANFRVLYASPETLVMNGASTAYPARWVKPAGPGYAATLLDNGEVISSASSSAGLTVTLPSTTALTAGWMVAAAADGGKNLIMQVNGTAGGSILSTIGGSVTTMTIPSRVMAWFQFDGSVFRLISQTGFGNAVDIRQYGALCDGTTNDHDALAAAFNSGFSIINFPPVVCYSATSLTLPAGVSVMGQDPSPGWSANNATAPFTLLLNSAATLTLSSHTGLRGFRIARFGVTAPTTMRQAITETSNFAGLAVSFSNAQDIDFNRMSINGFATAIQHRNSDRVHYEQVMGDDTNGLDLDGCFDACSYDKIEFWPFLSGPYGLDRQFESTAITAFSSGGGGAVRVTLLSAPQYPIQTNDIVVIGNSQAKYQVPNGRWTATRIDDTHFDLSSSSYASLCPSGCIATNEIAYLTSTRRTGTALSMKNTAGFITGFYEYGYDHGLIYGVNAIGMNCIGCWIDGDTYGGTYADPVPIGVQNGGPPGGASVYNTHNAFSGGKIYDQAYAIVNNSSGTTALLVSNTVPIGSTGIAANVTGAGIAVYTGGVQVSNAVLDAGGVSGNPSNWIGAIYDAAAFLELTDVNTTSGGNFFYQSLSDCAKFVNNGLTYCPWTPVIAGLTTPGTWTPNAGFPYGEYMQRQTEVTVWGYVNGTLSGASGNAIVTGLPAAAGGRPGDLGNCAISRAAHITLDAGYTQFALEIVSGQQVLALGELGSNKTDTAIQVGNLGGGTELAFVCHYHG